MYHDKTCRYSRLYEAYGNNISMSWSASSLGWKPYEKDTVFFAHFNSKVLRNSPNEVDKGIVLKRDFRRISFMAPGIRGIRLYNMLGRLMASKKQKPGTYIELGQMDNFESVRSGTYIARLMVGNREESLIVPIVR